MVAIFHFLNCQQSILWNQINVTCFNWLIVTNITTLHYGQRGLRYFRESSWCEIDPSLAQVPKVKLDILAPFQHRRGTVKPVSCENCSCF